MGDNPGRAARSCGSSMHRCFELLKAGDACATLSAGNPVPSSAWAASCAASGCDRPRFDEPTHRTKPTVLLDIGANVEVRAAHLAVRPDRTRLLQHSSRGGASNRRTSIEWQRGEQGHRYTSGGAPTAHPDAIELYRLCRGARSTGRLRRCRRDGWPYGERRSEVVRGDRRESIQAYPRRGAGQLPQTLPVALKGPLESLHEELDWKMWEAPLLGLNGLAMVAHWRSTSKAIAQSIIRTRAYSEVG